MNNIQRHRPDFVKELEHLINRYSIDSLCNTPDFILAEYISQSLDAYFIAHTANETWHGRGPKMVQVELKEVVNGEEVQKED